VAIEHSVDPLITELRQSLFTSNCQDVPVAVFDVLSASVSNINSATFKNNTRKNCHANLLHKEIAAPR